MSFVFEGLIITEFNTENNNIKLAVLGGNMKKAFRCLVVIFMVIISIFALVIFVSFVNHKLKLSEEDNRFVANGQIVDVNGRHMHVYTEGTGEETLVFMSGGGTSSPVFDFKSLYFLLSDQYKIAVVEKAGYGFSEVTSSNRDIDTILTETREALLKSGIKGPYTLFPHSMSGIEALYWAQTYPNEVTAIVGLDMATPPAYEDYQIPMTLVRLGGLAANSGLTRWIPNISESDAVKYGTLTDEEKELSKVVFYRRTSTKNMVNEIENIKSNAQKVGESRIPNVPMLLFASNGQETGFDEETWMNIQNDYINKVKNGKLIKVDAAHYIHNIKYKQIAEESKEFLDGLSDY